MSVFTFPPSGGGGSALIQYDLNGSPVTVNRDTSNPANTNALPVEIMGANGVVLNVTSGDLNVEILHNGSAPSSTRIGDGTTLVGVTTSNELKTTEQDIVSTGTITVIDSNPTGTSTPGSFVQVGCSGKNTVTFQVSGSGSGELAMAYTLNDSNWVIMTGSLLKNMQDGSISTVIGGDGVYSLNCSGMYAVKVWGITTISGTISITMLSSKGGDLVTDPVTSSYLASISAKLPVTLGQKTMAASTSVTVASDQSAIPTTNTNLDVALSTVAKDSTLSTTNTEIGSLTEAAPSSDTASSGLNGRLQRIAQNITSLIAKFTTTANGLKVDGSAVTQPTSSGQLPVSLGAKTTANSMAVNIASDQTVSVSGTITTTNASVGTTGSAVPASADLMGASKSGTMTALTMDSTNSLNVNLNNQFITISTSDTATQTAIGTTNTNLGTKSDAAATTDSGSFSLIALIKRVCGNITTVVTSLTNVTGSSGAGTAASNSLQVGMVYNSTPPTVTNGQQVALQSDSDGSLCVNIRDQASVINGTITTAQKTVGVSAVRATVSGSAPSARKKLYIKPSKNNTGAIYIGASGVTTTTGLEIIGPDRLEYLLDSNDYYIISDTATQTVEILEVY